MLRVQRYANTEAMQDHLEEISGAVDPGAHAVLMLDQAGWHMSSHLVVPANWSPTTCTWRDPPAPSPLLKRDNPVTFEGSASGVKKVITRLNVATPRQI